ncbi:MAG: hypothetical protein CMH53_09690 [Myxococcales bacterium]|nr:hypothetical protein [Myxococcales bacterium]
MSRLVALACTSIMVVAAPALCDAQIPTIQIDSITAAPDASSGFKPDSRLGLTTSLVGDTSVRHVINKADCETIKKTESAHIRLTWSWTNFSLSLTPPRYGVKIAPPGATCESTAMTESRADSGCIVIKSDQSFSSITPVGEFTDIDLNEVLGKTECASSEETDAKIYFIVSDPNTGIPNGATFTITIDTKAPSAPKINSIAAGNKNLKVAWEVIDEATTPFSRVYWSKITFPANAPSQATNRSELLTGASFQIAELENDQVYFVAVSSVDANDNESAAAEVVQASPVSVQDMWQYYKANGGASDGEFYGCGASPHHSQAPWALLVMLTICVGVIVRRRGTLLIIVLVVGSMSLPAARATAASPQTMSVDARFTNYEPMIDREFEATNGATPYADIMKEPALQWGASLDWRLWKGVGEFSAGLSIGYWSQKGKSRAYDGTASQDDTELVVVPITLDAVYRFTWLADKYDFPLVPYAKIGLAYGIWWAMDGTGEVSQWTGPDNKVYTGNGGVAGFHAVGGIRLLLDVFEPKAARGFDLEMGVNHSYVFIEVQRLALTNFGDAKALDLSDDLIVFGLAFDL